MNTKQETRVHAARTAAAFKQALADNLYYRRGTSVESASPHDHYVTLCYTIRDYLMERWRRTVRTIMRPTPSLSHCHEFLLGQQLPQNLICGNDLPGRLWLITT
jgi:starch phosphorylase